MYLPPGALSIEYSRMIMNSFMPDRQIKIKNNLGIFIRLVVEAYQFLVLP